ncbi:hypothetical protein LG202_22830 [Methylobacillus methanolivorans]
MQHHYPMPSFLIMLITSLFITACASTAIEQRHITSQKIAIDAGWQRFELDVGQFVLVAFVPSTQQADDQGKLTIYIEGDGLAWVDSRTPSFDPTPTKPLALQLAIRDQAHAVAYLGRACQYVTGDKRRNCSTRYWTNARFAPEVIKAANQAIDQLKQHYHAQHITLIGYSGGGAIATLSAASRNDVSQLITIAGNLDTATWTTQQHLSPLTGSLNPADAWKTLLTIPQRHYVGMQDKTVPPLVATAYRDRFPLHHQPEIISIPGFDHHCCWVEAWPNLLRQAPITSTD